MTKHQRVLLSGPSHCLWCGVVLGLLAAEQLNIPLTSVWHAVKGWHRTIPRRSVGQSPKPSVRKRA